MFKYKVDYWDSTIDEVTTDVGLVAAAAWGEATQRVLNYYGEDHVIGIYVEAQNDTVMYKDIILELFRND